jgi:hypothetical protein
MSPSAKSFTHDFKRQASVTSDLSAVRKRRGESQFTEDLPPTGEEASIQRVETIMPLVWAGLGLLLVVLYSIALGVR